MPIMIGKNMVQTYKEVGLGIPFLKLIQKRQEIKSIVDAAMIDLGDKKKDDPQNPGLNWQIERLMESQGLDAVVAGDWVVTRSQSKSVTIPRERLAQAMLEAGIESDVAEAVIEAATNTVPYTYIQVTRPKELEQRAAEGGFNTLPKTADRRPSNKKITGMSLVPKLKASIKDAKNRKRA